MGKNAIDIADVLERVQDDWELLFELFDIFEQDYAVKRKALGEYAEQKNFEKIRDVAHSLKGASGNISAKPLFHSFFQLEKLAEKKEMKGIPELLLDVDQQFTELMAEISELKKKKA